MSDTEKIVKPTEFPAIVNGQMKLQCSQNIMYSDKTKKFTCFLVKLLLSCILQVQITSRFAKLVKYSTEIGEVPLTSKAKKAVVFLLIFNFVLIKCGIFISYINFHLSV